MIGDHPRDQHEGSADSSAEHNGEEAAPHVSLGELLQVDPRELIIGANVRGQVALDREFVRSIRDRGVREPIQVRRRTGDGALVVRKGKRRTLGAIEAGQALVRVLVEPDVDPGEDDTVGQVERIVDQLRESRCGSAARRCPAGNRFRITSITYAESVRGPTVRAMPVAEVDRQIGPQHGRLILHTSREGVGAQLGHDLTIEVTRWSGRLRFAANQVASELTVTVDMRSMDIVDGIGGIAPLSERDKREILRNAWKILSVDRYPEGTFVAERISEDAVDGTLSLLGRSHELRLAYRIDGEHYRASGTVRQSDYGIKPFSAFFGALKLADAVRVRAELDRL